MSAERTAHYAALADDIQAFHNYIQAERGLAANTLLAYGRDLDRFSQWVAGGGLVNYLAPTIRDLSHYLEHLRDEGLAPPSVARHLVALKMFYRFLRLEERTTDSTVDVLSSPALWERIPHVLSPDNVNKLLDAPQPLDRFCLRDRAILEALYATGSRASEVVDLQIGRPISRLWILQVHRQGQQAAHRAVGQIRDYRRCGDYLEEQRPSLVLAVADAPNVFVSRGGKALTREMLWVLVKKYVQRPV